MERNPDRFFRYDVWALVDAVRRSVAAMLKANWADLVFIPNASNGVNVVLRSLKVPPGKKVLYLNTAYGMVKSTIEYTAASQKLEVNLTMPTSAAAILAAVETALTANPGAVYIASFSHIASLPALLLPVKALTALCHKHGALVMIDGAHALGHVDVNVSDINADFWLANGHKWLYSPKGSAVLHVRADRQALIKPLTISWDEGQGVSDFQNMFSYQGTASYTPYLAMGAALEFRAWLGGDERIFAYLHALAAEGGALLARAWGTNLLSSPELFAGMVDVRVPTANATLAGLLPGLLLEEYNTWVPVYDLAGFGGPPNNF